MLALVDWSYFGDLVESARHDRRPYPTTRGILFKVRLDSV